MNTISIGGAAAAVSYRVGNLEHDLPLIMLPKISGVSD